MTTASENRNILQLDELAEAFPSAQFYAVHNNRDFRISLETLLTLVNKAYVGLGNVDNTADADKPVSVPTQIAITEAIEGLVGREEFDLFVNGLQSLITQEKLDQTVALLTQVIDSKLDQQQVVNIVVAALQPIEQQIQILGQSVTNALERIAIIEGGQYVTSLQLTTAVNQITQETDQKVGQARTDLVNMIQLLSQSVDNRVLLLTQNINAVSAALANKSDRGHGHNIDSIEGLTAEIQRIINETPLDGDFILGNLDW